MNFDATEFKNFLAQLTATRQQVQSIMSSTPGADFISETILVLIFQSLFDVLMTTKDPEKRLEYIGKIKDLVSTLNTRRDIERKSQNSSEKNKAPLDAASVADLEERLKLL